MYVLPLIVSASLINASAPWVSWVLCFAFIAKFVTPAWIDYEAYFHWDMHCDILAMHDAPHLTRAWRGICEWILGPAVGSLPHLYSTEHLIIHHPANAGPKDIHSPLPYARTSVLEFAHYSLKTVLVLCTTLGVVQHPRCRRGDQALLVGGIVFVWGIAVASILNQHLLGYWLPAALAFRGTNTAIAQYVWHGLHDGTGKSSPLSTTILWLPDHLPTASGTVDDPPGTFELLDPVHPREGLIDVIPQPGSDWAFFDNYHLVHHLHPRAHFSEYPRLLDLDLPRAVTADSPVLTLDVYATFFADLMARDLERIASGLAHPSPPDQRVRLVRDRLMPWPGVRSRVSVVTESRIGSRVDARLSRAWAHLRQVGV